MYKDNAGPILIAVPFSPEVTVPIRLAAECCADFKACSLKKVSRRLKTSHSLLGKTGSF